MQSSKQQFKLRSKAGIALLLIVVVLLLDAMAACPALHELIHKDADSNEHQCAATLFAHGQVDTATVDVPVAIPQAFVFTVPQIEISSFAPAIENLPAGRAPPFLA